MLGIAKWDAFDGDPGGHYVKLEIGAAANAGADYVFRTCWSRRGEIRLQATTKLGVADDLILRQIDHRWLAIVSHRSEVLQISGRSYRLGTRDIISKRAKAPLGSPADEMSSKLKTGH